MFQTQTYDDPLVLPPEARDHWAFMETNSACAVMKATCPSEWSDIVHVLSSDLPLNFHPTATGARFLFTPVGAG